MENEEADQKLGNGARVSHTHQFAVSNSGWHKLIYAVIATGWFQKRDKYDLSNHSSKGSNIEGQQDVGDRKSVV